MLSYQVRLTRDAYLPGMASSRTVEVQIDETASLHYGQAHPELRAMWADDCHAMARAKASRLLEARETVTGWVAPSDTTEVATSDLVKLNARIAELEAEKDARAKVAALEAELAGL